MIKKNESEILFEDEETRVNNAIGMADQMCYAMGGNDREHEILEDIRRKYKEGRLTADQAIKDAQAVPENKIQR